MPPPSEYKAIHVNPRAYSVNATEKAYVMSFTSKKAYSFSATEQAFSMSFTSPEYTASRFTRPTSFTASNPIIDNSIYAPGASIICFIDVTNFGANGEKELFWEVVNEGEEVLSSGSQMSGIINKWDTETISLSGIYVPDNYQYFHVRFKIEETGDWLYSTWAHSLPVDLTVTSVNSGSDIYWPDTAIDCYVHVTNAGFAGSQMIEWQVINVDNSEILNSGSQSSGTIADFGSADVSLTGIVSPSGGDIKFKVRSRIVGSSTWIYSFQMTNYLYWTPPENPPPRDPPPPP